ncbi:hypothetical protein Tco_0392698 [Tanacetum coccineum]
MTYFVTILTPDSAWSCVMQCTLPTEGMRSIISTVSISLEGFLPSILLLVMIIVTVVIVAVILVVVVVAVIAVMIIGLPPKFEVFEAVTFPSMLWGSPPMKASISFSEFGTMFGHKTANSWNLLTPGDNASSVRVPVANVTLFSSAQLLREYIDSVRSNQRMRISLSPVFLLGLSAFAMAAACASRAAAMPSVMKISQKESESRELNIDGDHHVKGQLLWKTVLSWRTVECKFNGKITIVILVRDRSPRGKGQGSLETRLGHVWELEDDVLKLHDDLLRLRTRLKWCLSPYGAAICLGPKERMWSFCNQQEDLEVLVIWLLMK